MLFGEKSNLFFYIDNFKPSWKRRAYESWVKANGLTPREAVWLQVRKELERDNFDKCYICDLTPKRVLGLTNLIPTYDENLKSIEYVCSDHGGEWWNCLTGEAVIFSHKPYWKRQLRNNFYNFISAIITPVRFTFFFLQDIYFWHVAIWFYWGWKELKRKLCES